jgi:RNA polymerase sigma factor (sigma-70 family)
MRVIYRRNMQITSEILKKCEENDRRAQKELYEICFRMHISVCFSYVGNEEDARSLLNAGFLKICKNIETIKQNPKVFFSWSKKIIVNTIIDEYRKKKRYDEHVETKEHDRELEFSNHSNSNSGLETLEEEDIKKMIASLPDSTRKVFVLYVVEGYNHKEIGDLLEMSEGTSKWHLSTARKLLREMLQREEDELSQTKKMIV